MVTGYVVNITKKEKKYVQKGSKYHNLGQANINPAVKITPIEFTMSPIICTVAASRLILLYYLVFTGSFCFFPFSKSSSWGNASLTTKFVTLSTTCVIFL